MTIHHSGGPASKAESPLCSISLETSWKNNVRMDGGFYPGSGFQTPGDGTSGAIRGETRAEGGARFTLMLPRGEPPSDLGADQALPLSDSVA